MVEVVTLESADGLAQQSRAEKEQDVGRDDEEDGQVDAGGRGVDEVWRGSAEQ